MRALAADAPACHLQRRVHAVDRDEAELPRRHRVAAARDEHRAEPDERGLARRPVREREQRVAGAAFAVRGERAGVLGAAAARRRGAPRARGRSASRRRTCGRAAASGGGSGARSGCTRIAVPPSTTGNESRQSLSARPRPSCAACKGLGRSRGRCSVVGGMPTTIASSGSSSTTSRASIARSSASACATAGGPANTAAAVRSRRSERDHARAKRSGHDREERAVTASPRSARPRARRTGSRASDAARARMVRAPARRRSAGRVRRARARARVATRQPCDAAVSSSDHAPAARIASGPGRGEERSRGRRGRPSPPR